LELADAGANAERDARTARAAAIEFLNKPPFFLTIVLRAVLVASAKSLIAMIAARAPTLCNVAHSMLGLSLERFGGVVHPAAEDQRRRFV
jgi:hypothetical protein